MARMLIAMRVCLTSFALMCLLSACAPPVSEGGFNAPDPASKIYAIEDAVRANDTNDLSYIVEQLDSDDPAVRLVAISALQRMTGETYGYRYYAPRSEREDSIKRWVDVCKQRNAAPNGADETKGEPSHDG